jgi:YQGE family putative transporter
LFFHVVVFALTPLGTIISIFFLKYASFAVNIKISFGIFAALQVVFLHLMYSKDPFLLPLIAILTALGNGFYWISYSLFITKHIANSLRDRVASIIGMVSGCVMIVMPLFSGAIISIFHSLWGYVVVVVFSVIVVIFTLLCSKKLSEDKNPNFKTQFKPAVQLVFSNKVWRICSMSELLKGLREGLFAFYPSLLLFAMVRKEHLVAINIFAIGVVSTISNKLYGRTRKLDDLKYMAIAIHVLTAMAVVFLIKPAAITIVALGLANAFFNLYMINPVMKTFYFLVNACDDGKCLTSELFAIRSCFLAVGRVLGILLGLAVSSLGRGVAFAILLLTLSQYITLLLCKKVTSSLIFFKAKQGQVDS